jgi:pimeloyl-ACP methyl ester carboxylesterase
VTLLEREVGLVVPRGNHFPMGDAPDIVVESIRSFWRDKVEKGR